MTVQAALNMASESAFWSIERFLNAIILEYSSWVMSVH